MKFFAKVVLSLAIILSIVCPVFNFNVYNVNAAQITTTATGYTQASDVNYITDNVSGKSVYRNWGARGEVATFLTTKAASYYNSSITYSVLSKNAGGTSQSNAPSSALYSSLKSMMTSKHKNETSYNATRDFYGHTDGVGNVATKLSTFYTGKLVNSTWDGGNTYNREHTWPNSKGLGGNDENDIMMLRPEQPNANSSRGNKAYGQSSNYFDPGESVRGDVARIALYVYVRWGNTSYMWGTSGVIESVTVLLNWMQEDPVDTWELARNDVVESITGVRNVFVDYPEYAYLMFGYSVPKTMQTPSGIAQNGTAGGDGLPEVPDIEDNTPSEDEINELLAKDTLTVAEAKKIGSSMDHDTVTDKKFTITGDIVDVSNTTYGNMNVTDSTGETIYVYGTWSADGNTRYDALSYKPVAGDTVTLYTVVGNYNGPQLKNAWIKGAVEGGGNQGGNQGGTTTPDYDDETMLALFTFGANGSAHNDGNDMGTTKTYTEGKYSLVIQNAVKVFAGAYDQVGNSCIKLGTSKLTGSFEFTVPSDVEYVVLNIAQYKANTSKVTINGTTHTISTSSNFGEYTAITVDTTSNKKITVETISSALRVMIDSISFHSSTPSSGGNGGGEVTPPEVETLTIAQSLEMGSLMTHNTTTDVKYYVSGVVTEITNTQYGNMYIKDESGASILVYGTYSADGNTRFDALSVQPEVGDTVKLLTVVGNYNGAQLKNAWILEIIPGEGGNQGGGTVTPPVEIETITISQALEMGAALAHNTLTPVKYYIEGVIVEVKDTYYGNMTIKDKQGNTILVYGSFSADGVKRFGEMENTPVAGDTVKLLSVVSNYNGAQLKNAWILEFSNSGGQGGENPGDGEDEPCKHSYGEWVVVEPATETEEGLKVKTCRHCGDEVSETIPALGATDSTIPSDSTSESDSESTSERQKAQGCNSSLSGSLLGSLGLVFALFAIAKKSKEN